MRALVVEDFEDMLEFLEFILTTELGYKTVLAKSGHQAMDILKKDAHFDVIISDLNMPNGSGADLYQFCQKQGIQCPFVILSGDRLDQHPVLKSTPVRWISKPFEVSEVLEKLKDLAKNQAPPTDHYVPVSLNLLKHMHSINTSLFIRINDQKYVKVTSGESVFDANEFDKYTARGLRYLYIESTEADAFIATYRKKVLSISAWQDSNSNGHELISLNTELLKDLSHMLGWEAETIELAKQSVHKALHLVKAHPALHNLFNQFHKIERYGFADHCTVALMLGAGLLRSMGYADEMSLAKIAFASLLHDMNLTDAHYFQKAKLMKKIVAGEKMSKDMEVIFHHPGLAAKLCRNWDFCPPDVDQMILSHHERPDGKGFPAKKNAVDLDFMTCVFIVAEDLSDYFMEHSGKVDLVKYAEARKPYFNKGHFTSIFRALETAIHWQDTKAS